MRFARILAGTFALGLALFAAPPAWAVLLNGTIGGTGGFAGQQGARLVVGNLEFEVRCLASAGVCGAADLSLGSGSNPLTFRVTGAGGGSVFTSNAAVQDLTLMVLVRNLISAATINGFAASWVASGSSSVAAQTVVNAASASVGSISLSVAAPNSSLTFAPTNLLTNGTAFDFKAPAGGSTITSITFAVNQVPEPATLGLLLVGMLGLGSLVRRRR